MYSMYKINKIHINNRNIWKAAYVYVHTKLHKKEAHFIA